MLTLRSCSSLRSILIPPSSSSYFVSFPNPNSSFLLSLPVNFQSNFAMSSSRPSAFETLMANARAASAKSKSQSSKRKIPASEKVAQTLNSVEPPQNPALSDSKSLSQVQKEDDSKIDQDLVNQPQKPRSENPTLPLLSAKKQRLEIVQLTSKIESLKKSPMEFDPKTVLFWEKGEKVPFLFASLSFELIGKESRRILITNIASNTLRTVMDTTPDDLPALVYLMANKIAPPHEGLELGIGDGLLFKALAEAFGMTVSQIKARLDELGDLGLVAQESRSSQSMMRKPDPLTVAKVFNTFRLIAKESGKDSQDKKRNHVKALLVAAANCEPQYLVRLLQGKLRINLAEKTVLAALGQAAVCTDKFSTSPADIKSPLEEAAGIVKHVYSVLPVYDKIVSALLSDGVWNLRKICPFTLGVPIGPMLANSVTSISQIINKFENMQFTCEYKYDGERAQIHYLENDSVEIYSRNSERNTGKYPDVVSTISRLKRPAVKSFVLDCEIVAYNREERKILPFQVLSKRARKNVTVSDIKVDVCMFAFDMLYLNGEPLLQEQLEVRRQRLYESFEEDPGFFQFATAVTSNDLEEIQKFLDAAIGASCEGLIIKTLNKEATYEPSKRSNNWLKLKKDYMDSFGDSLDLVPIAAFHGRGKRTGVYGAFLLACYDYNNDEYQSICKIGTGFSEQKLENLSNSLRSKVIPKPKSYYRYGDKTNPDVWFEPSEVWEVKAADLTISPAHSAAIGLVEEDKGISLRFPRLVRVREDKSPDQASSSEQVAQLYRNQDSNQAKDQNEEDEGDE